MYLDLQKCQTKIRRRYLIFPAVLCLLGGLLFLSVGCGSEFEESDSTLATTAELNLPGLSLTGQTSADTELVYRHVRTTNPDGQVDVEETGSLSLAQFQRAARPYAYSGPDEDWLYEESATSDSTAEGAIIDVYEVRREMNSAPVTTLSTPDAQHVVRFAPLVEELAEEADDLIDLIALIRDFPVFYLPLTPPAHMMSLNTAQELSQQREAVRSARLDAANQMSQGFRADVVAAGGVVYDVIDWGGAVFFSYPVDQLDDLRNHDEIYFVEPADDPTDSNNNGHCTAGDQSCYDNGNDNYLGRMRSDLRVGVEAYWNANHTGATPNNDRHQYGRLVAGVVEGGSYFDEDVPCSFSDDHFCFAERILERYDCQVWNTSDPSSASCVFFGQWTSSQLEEGTNHGTLVSSIILGNYLNGQGDSFDLKDPHFDDHGYHTQQWESDATGMAPDAGLIFFQGRHVGYRSLSYSTAYDFARRLNVDVLNLSHHYQVNSDEDEETAFCDPVFSGLRQNALAGAFDDGIFVVGTSGNRGTHQSCTIAQPGSMPRVFTVSGLDMNNNACQSNYTDCPIHLNSSRRGGADISINGVVYPEAYSLVDVTAPSRFRRGTVTNNDELSDPITPAYVHEGLVGGSSVAAPIVSGSALVVKDYLIGEGYGWINSPGRLFSIILSMADRWHHYASSRANSGADLISGVGRFKLRPLRVGAQAIIQRWSMWTRTFTPSTADHVRSPWSTPMNSGAELAKCTTIIPQDHRTSTDVADIDLLLLVREPVHGECVEGEGTIVAYEFDGSRDTKQMTAIENSSVPGGLAGRCFEYWLFNNHVPAGESQMTNTFCYISTIDDNEPN